MILHNNVCMTISHALYNIIIINQIQIMYMLFFQESNEKRLMKKKKRKEEFQEVVKFPIEIVWIMEPLTQKYRTIK